MPLDSSYNGYVLRYRHSDQSFVMTAPETGDNGPVTLVLSQFFSEVPGSGTIDSASWSPGANHLLLCCIGMRGIYAPDVMITGVSGNGLTWTKVIDQNDTQNAVKLSIWMAMGPSPTPGVVTVTQGGFSINSGIHLLSFSGVNVASPIGNVASAQTGAADSSPAIVNLTTAAADSVVLGFVMNRNQTQTFQAGQGWTGIFLNQIIDSGGNLGRSGSFYKTVPTAGTLVQVQMNLSAVADWVIAGIEIKT